MARRKKDNIQEKNPKEHQVKSEKKYIKKNTAKHERHEASESYISFGGRFERNFTK